MNLEPSSEVNGLTVRLRLAAAISEGQFGWKVNGLIVTLTRLGLLQASPCDSRERPEVCQEPTPNAFDDAPLRTTFSWSCGCEYVCRRRVGWSVDDEANYGTDALAYIHCEARRNALS